MIYLDCASTSLIKPISVSDAVCNAMSGNFGNPGRGSGSSSLESSRLLLDARKNIGALFSIKSPDNVILKSSVTESLNTLMIGLLKKGDHVISSVMEHNSVLRPLERLRQNGIITYDLLGADDFGRIKIEEIRNLEKKETKLIVLTHASNLCGTVQDITSARQVLRNKDIFIAIDAAQTAGYIPVNINELSADAIAFTGHKGLLGPQGTGGFIVNDRLDSEMVPVFTGGTGSDSSSLSHPMFLPDKYEAGTANIPGIAGLSAGVNHILEEGLDSILSKSRDLMIYFLDELERFSYINLHGLNCNEGRIPCFSLTVNDLDPSFVSYVLDNEFGITTRSGLHCAPLAHRVFGTEISGSLRISFNHMTNEGDIDALFSAFSMLKGVSHD
ncbi:aminotransferase class V-fold PLP-dependent enzyme [Youngiibacter multivorans]|nr:aminotransferase class V-fold PLP-dependent enzyme [Youngiibacter multivorans]